MCRCGTRVWGQVQRGPSPRPSAYNHPTAPLPLPTLPSPLPLPTRSSSSRPLPPRYQQWTRSTSTGAWPAKAALKWYAPVHLLIPLVIDALASPGGLHTILLSELSQLRPSLHLRTSLPPNHILARRSRLIPSRRGRLLPQSRRLPRSLSVSVPRSQHLDWSRRCRHSRLGANHSSRCALRIGGDTFRHS